MDYLWPCVIIVLLSSLWTAYLDWRQRKVYMTPKVPEELVGVFKQDMFDKSRHYQLDKSLYGSLHSLYKIVEFLVFIAIGMLPIMWGVAGSIVNYIGFNETYEGLQSSIFIIIYLIYSDITNIPWSIYYHFVLEEKHGFNKQTYGFFAKDQVKKLLLQCVLIPPIFSALIVIIKWGGTYFYVYAWVFVLIVTLVFIMIYHDLIAPCFDKYTAVPDGELKTAIEHLAQSLNFPLKKLYIVEGSKRSAHSNAYFYGFGSNKRIVLFDTLLQKGMIPSEQEKDVVDNEEEKTDEGMKENEVEDKGCTIDEILAILSHELGHWYYSHTLKNIILMEVNLFLSFFLFGYFLNQQDMFDSFGFVSSRPIIIGLIIVFELIFTPYNLLFHFIAVQMIRGFEYQADAFANNLKQGPALISALTKLVKENLSFPIADYLYANFNHTHPTFLERIQTLKTKQE